MVLTTVETITFEVMITHEFRVFEHARRPSVAMRWRVALYQAGQMNQSRGRRGRCSSRRDYCRDCRLLCRERKPQAHPGERASRHWRPFVSCTGINDRTSADGGGSAHRLPGTRDEWLPTFLKNVTHKPGKILANIPFS